MASSPFDGPDPGSAPDPFGEADPAAGVFTSEAITRGVRVRVRSFYDAQRSDPRESQWFFLYTVRVHNEGEGPVQLLARHWIVRDEQGHAEEVRGPGVVGEQPVIPPGSKFEYTSGCPLGTSTGTMEGSYLMAAADGEHFEARIAPFTLSEPYVAN
ncbi:MAG: Co2+/Mg2+ efflux protein ApaG [Holophagales bacterium]|nr:Co2+/Mg2+ efflux protein ApaG [Holophagales bacterium]